MTAAPVHYGGKEFLPIPGFAPYYVASDASAVARLMPGGTLRPKLPRRCDGVVDLFIHAEKIRRKPLHLLYLCQTGQTEREVPYLKQRSAYRMGPCGRVERTTYEEIRLRALRRANTARERISQRVDPRETLANLRRMERLYAAWAEGGDIRPLKEEVERVARETVAPYMMRRNHLSRPSAVELAAEVSQQTLLCCCEGRCALNLPKYMCAMAVRLAAERRRALGRWLGGGDGLLPAEEEEGGPL